ncbi:hypothetical protein JVT61DRAFT_8668 [Boletus reticuloceps]|uniref:Uncharacterized protein n=1 Tax=Boletus reticuloceps TaxID=495285 RepID=A0A8I2YEC0_9AGAM|nr:hypothetical protein JVT61DRAFT_12272 [Boletus reticuloceps]KAG6380508.1 hypothetical protein JVT61DRAFT_8668 [Boletus reticuloceps]
MDKEQNTPASVTILQRQVEPHTAPLPSIYYPDFIAANQEARADNIIPGADKEAHLEYIRDDIQRFKSEAQLDRVVVFWTANTERYSDIIPGVNDTADNLVAAIEVSPSTLFAVASILEGELHWWRRPQVRADQAQVLATRRSARTAS